MRETSMNHGQLIDYFVFYDDRWLRSGGLNAPIDIWFIATNTLLADRRLTLYNNVHGLQTPSAHIALRCCAYSSTI